MACRINLSTASFWGAGHLVIGLILFLGGTAWMPSDDPPNPPAESFPPQAGFAATNTDADRIPEHVAKDPVFQELSKAFLNSNPSKNSVTFSPGAMSDNIWHAIENTLRTARQLESEEARLKASGEFEKAKKHREIIDNLRLQGAKLLANELQITIS
ncbi:MAG: hypothetical protein ACK5PB_16350 [Pirellula sp.]|jgi:hypothetical protein